MVLNATAARPMSGLERLRERLERHQIALYFAAVLLGWALARSVPGIERLEPAIQPALGLMLFVTFLQMPLARLRDALPRVRFLGALLVANFLVVPGLLALMWPWLPADPLIRVAMAFVLLCPCIDYVVTFSHLGKADAPSLLAATPLLLIAQMLLLPLYLKHFAGAEAAALVQAGPFLRALLWLIAIPLLLAALVQGAASRDAAAAVWYRRSLVLPVPATALVLLIVVAVVTPQLGFASSAALAALPVYIAFAIVVPVLGLLVGQAFALPATARRSIAFSAATRNSLVILPLALSIPGALPVVPAVIVTQTLVELIAMLVYIPAIRALSGR